MQKTTLTVHKRIADHCRKHNQPIMPICQYMLDNSDKVSMDHASDWYEKRRKADISIMRQMAGRMSYGTR